MDIEQSLVLSDNDLSDNRKLSVEDTTANNVVDDTFISPYNSPQKNYFDINAAGDFCSANTVKGIENDLSVANRETDSSQILEKVNAIFENDMLKELKSMTQSDNKEHLLYLDDAPEKSSLSCENLSSDNMLENVDDKSLTNHLLLGEKQDCKEKTDVSNEDITFVPETERNIDDCDTKSTSKHNIKENESPCTPDKEKILAEMLASAAKTTPNNELSHDQMVSISRKMEEEFRSMFIEEQQKKKLLMEGASYSELSNSYCSPTAKEITSSKKTNQSPKTFESKIASPRRLTATKSKGLNQPLSTQTKNTAHKQHTTTTPNRQHTAISANLKNTSRSTPTTIRITAKSPNSVTRSAPKFTSPREKRTPLQSTTLRTNNTPARKPAYLKSYSPLNTTPLKPTTVRSPRSALIRSPTPTTPKRTPSSQSSDSGRPRPNMPATKNVQSKIGSMQNAKHTPGGGKIKIESKKVDYSKVTSKVGSKANMNHTPTGGKVRIESKKLDYSSVGSKCDSMANTNHTPGGGKVEMLNKKLDFSRVVSKCGSLDNVTHSPGGGKVKVESKKLDFSNVSSKCGSKANLKHVPHVGNVKIFDEKRDFTIVKGKIGSLDNVHHTPGGGKVRIYHEKIDTSKVQSRVGSKDNLTHTPGGGKMVKIVTKSIDVSNVKSKCGSLENTQHVAGGGDVQIYDEKPFFKETAKSKVGSLENADHVAGGGNVQIYDEKLTFCDTAAPRTDTGFNGTGSLSCKSSGSISST